MEDRTLPFVEYLEHLRDHPDQSRSRAALAELRRGLGQPPGTAHEMYPYVVPFLPNDAGKLREDAYFLIAALFAYHPEPGGSGNMGSHFAGARDPSGDNSAIERRFAAVLAAHVDDLPIHLRQAVGFLRSRQPEIPVNWHRLFTDLLGWTHPSGYVQKEWARAFWGRTKEEPTTQPATQTANPPATS
jgi:CRISPR type I-E-associated protein CasB/Cse2